MAPHFLIRHPGKKIDSVITHPKIRDHLVRYLTPTILTICIRVCKGWQKSFTPNLWREFRLESYRHPGIQTIILHAPFVHTLICNIMPFQDVIVKSDTLVFPHLSVLTFEDNYACHLENDDLEPFMKKHGHTLKRIYIGQLYNDDQMEFEWMTHCKALESVYLGGRAMQYEKYWRLCVKAWRYSRLKELEFHDVHFPADDLKPWKDEQEKADFLKGPMMSIRRFSLRKIYQLKISGCTEFLKLCPDLRHICLLNGSSSTDRTALQEFLDCLKGNQWPHLTSLRLDLHWGLDQIIEARAEADLTELDLEDSGFDKDIWNALQRSPRLVATLETLNLDNCRYVTSNMIHKMLATLPNIKTFSAPVMHDGDIYEGIDSHRWVCLGLKSFKVTIRVYSGPEGHAAFHRKLGLLTNLEKLWTDNHVGDHNGLCYRLDVGLDALKGLAHLKYVDFAKPSSLSNADVSWMATHWRRLESAPRPVIGSYNKKRWTLPL
ncbi:hypothetical protein EMPS_06803 [Entomortierella parvispora]|uniref:F-box domain-containing protein n=1 Tax=Entomortierella parvispora TaxID=205924 RepID=A0A9P3HCZ0_9FUNG|nr:hypothetical protein EMPS_06803 [Entomortierella parvispora]